jgi:hypothetical protein
VLAKPTLPRFFCTTTTVVSAAGVTRSSGTASATARSFGTTAVIRPVAIWALIRLTRRLPQMVQANVPRKVSAPMLLGTQVASGS